MICGVVILEIDITTQIIQIILQLTKVVCFNTTGILPILDIGLPDLSKLHQGLQMDDDLYSALSPYPFNLSLLIAGYWVCDKK